MKSSAVMNTIFYGLITFAVVVLLFGIFRSKENITRPGPEPERQVAVASALISPEPFFNFGNISMAAGKVSHKFGIRNAGDTAITINKIYTSCMCTVATLVTLAGRKGPFGMPGHDAIPTIAERIAPGDGAQVEVVFDPAAHGPAGIGPTDRIVMIRTNETSPLELRFAAMVKP